jgi:hypothetical protein
MSNSARTQTRISPFICNGFEGVGQSEKNVKIVILDLEGSCSIQLSYGRKHLKIKALWIDRRTRIWLIHTEA